MKSNLAPEGDTRKLPSSEHCQKRAIYQHKGDTRGDPLPVSPKELIKRFEEVESWVNERDPKLARDLYILREAHKAYEMTWCRIKYHPSLLKVRNREEILE
ncbi:hypothetical protein E2C01_065095 [Portunus trituberculatus]|uniref:Uncharacterized protein n=1 Tax=Portunus trituberculatus TaxID=210409 RepID=A0A5B7HQT5_PORTR|nr:hypothetical protein [Portunus trituberculatus]